MESYGGREPAAAEFEHRPFEEPEEQEEEKECSSCCSLRALACCVRVTPWITALSVVLIFAGLPFWAVYTRSALGHTQALLDGTASAATSATPPALLLPILRTAAQQRLAASSSRPMPGPSLRLDLSSGDDSNATTPYTSVHPRGSEGPVGLMPWLAAAVEWATSIGVVAVAALAGLAALLGAARCYQSAAQRPRSRCGAPGRGAYALYLVGAAAVNPLVWLLLVAAVACLVAQGVWLSAAWAARAALGPQGIAFAAAAVGSRLAAATLDRAPGDFALAAAAMDALKPLAAKPAAPQAIRDFVSRVQADAPIGFSVCPATCLSVGSLARPLGLPSACVCMRRPALAAAQASADAAWVALLWSSAAMAVVAMAASWLLASGAAGSARVRRDLRYLPGRVRGGRGSTSGGGATTSGGGGGGGGDSNNNPLRAPRRNDNESMLRGGANASHQHAPDRPASVLDALAIKEKEAAAVEGSGGGRGWRGVGGRRSSSGGSGGGGLFGGGGWRLGARRPSRDADRASKDKDADVRITLVPAGAAGSCGGGRTGGGAVAAAEDENNNNIIRTTEMRTTATPPMTSPLPPTANPLVRGSAAVARSPSPPPSAPPPHLLPDAVVGGTEASPLETAAAAVASRRAAVEAPSPLSASPPAAAAQRSPAAGGVAGVSTTAQRYAAYRLRAAQEAAAAAAAAKQQQQ